MGVGFVVFDIECMQRLNAEGQRVIPTSNHGDVVVDLVEEPRVPAFFSFDCPLHKGQKCGFLRLADGPADKPDHPKWVWNGDRECPTLTPSINCLAHNPANLAEKYGGCGWHGFITNGEYT